MMLMSGVLSKQIEFVPVAVSVGLAGWALTIWGAVNYARWKGYSGWFGFFGYLLLVGLAVLACFPNRRKHLFRDCQPEKLGQVEELSQADRKPGYRFLLALGPLMVVGVILLILVLPNSALAAKQWEEVVPPASGFRALMPGTPRIQQKTQETPAGNIEVCKFIVEKKGTFMICSIRFPPDMGLKLGGVEKLLEIGRKDILACLEAVHGDVDSERHIT